MGFFNKSASLFILAGLLGIGADAQAIVPRGEGNTKHPLLKKLGESAVFKSHIRQVKLQDAQNKWGNSPAFKAQERQLKLEEARDGLPRSVFENPKNPKASPLSIPLSTGAGPLHKLGHTGKGMTIAIIDSDFSRPTITGLLKKKLLHEGAQHLYLPDQGPLEKLDMEALARKSYDLKLKIIEEQNPKKREVLVQARRRAKALLQYKASSIYNQLMEDDQEGHYHGDMVLEAAHKMAPGATILPLPFRTFPKGVELFFGAVGEHLGKDHPGDEGKDQEGEVYSDHLTLQKYEEFLQAMKWAVDDNENHILSLKELGCFLKLVQRAIDAKVDVINLSMGYALRNSMNMKPLVRLLGQARDAGIAIVMCAGNDSEPLRPIPLEWGVISCTLDGEGNRGEINEKVKSLAAHMLEALNYQGALVAGSNGYQPDGTSFVSDFSQVPESPKSAGAFLLAPGQQLRLCGMFGEDIIGTSFSSPVVAGAYALLKSYALTHNLPFKNPHDLLQVLRMSGTPVRNHPWKAYKGAPRIGVWNTLNVMAACQLLEERVIPKK